MATWRESLNENKTDSSMFLLDALYAP